MNISALTCHCDSVSRSNKSRESFIGESLQHFQHRGLFVDYERNIMSVGPVCRVICVLVMISREQQRCVCACACVISLIMRPLFCPPGPGKACLTLPGPPVPGPGSSEVAPAAV